MHTFVMRVYTSLPDRGQNPMTHMPTAAAHVYTCIIRINVSYVYVYPPTFRADLKGIKVRTFEIHTKQDPARKYQRARKVHFPHVHQWTEHILYSLVEPLLPLGGVRTHLSYVYKYYTCNVYTVLPDRGECPMPHLPTAAVRARHHPEAGEEVWGKGEGRE